MSALAAVLGFMIVGSAAIRAGRRALAAGLIHEISETSKLLATHDVELGLARFGDGARPPAWDGVKVGLMAMIVGNTFALAFPAVGEATPWAAVSAEVFRRERAR